MKIIILILFFTITNAYEDVDDKYDFNELFHNSTELRRVLGCVLDKLPCSDIIQHYKDHIFEAVTDGCRECSNLQKHSLRIFLDGLEAESPEDFKAYKAKYDPDGTHFDKLEEIVHHF